MTLRLFPFDDAMRFGFGVLHLSSDAFWSLTPRELRAALKAHLPAARELLRHSDLSALMTRFPDHHPCGGDDAERLS